MKNILRRILRRNQFNSLDYWESRYACGGNSGDGSYGRLSVFKSNLINKFLVENRIITALELGCGDGHQLSTIEYASYTGLDVSTSVINQCKKRFSDDESKCFVVYDPATFLANKSMQVDLTLSLDVLYHIVEDEIYLKYLEDLFALSKQYVIVYSTNFNSKETQHVLHRKFTDDVERIFDGYKLTQHIRNPYPGNGHQESLADFFVFRQK